MPPESSVVASGYQLETHGNGLAKHDKALLDSFLPTRACRIERRRPVGRELRSARRANGRAPRDQVLARFDIRGAIADAVARN